jgi:hypothetical protein
MIAEIALNKLSWWEWLIVAAVVAPVIAMLTSPPTFYPGEKREKRPFLEVIRDFSVNVVGVVGMCIGGSVPLWLLTKCLGG